MQLFIVGLQAGAQYAILAAALVTVFITTRVVNFAVGFYATAAVYAVIAGVALGLNPALALVAGLIVAGSLGALTETAIASPILKRLPRQGAEVVLIATLLVWGLGEGLLRILFGPDPRSFPRMLLARGSISVGGVPVTYATALTVLSVLAVLAVTAVIVFKTRVGVATRAAAENASSLALLGDNPRLYRLISWGYAGIVAALAGYMIAQTATPAPGLTNNALIKATAGAAVGGITSVPGAVLGAVLVGVLEAYGTVWIGPWAASVIPLVLIILTLIVKPTGLFGRAQIARV